MQDDLRYSDTEFIWCFINPEKSSVALMNKSNVKIIRKGNYIKYFYYLLTSKVVIYNCGGFSYAPMRKQQLVVETWHGGGAFKKVGHSVKNKSNVSKKGISIASKEISVFLASCELGTKRMIRDAMDYNGDVLNSGLPRNDILFKNDEQCIVAVKEKLGIDKDAKIVLYAPTFKGDEHHAVNINNKYEVINPMIIKQALKSRFFGEKWLFFTRGHQYADEVELQGADGDWSSYPDMQELLLVADILITDYSSSIWDFALTGKPCFLFIPDVGEYDEKERGFFTPVDTWPAIAGISNDELAEKIRAFSEQPYWEKVKSYMDTCGSYENGNACELVKKYIKDRI
jgi:CDP-glycerol glycerophosphotransferase